MFKNRKLVVTVDKKNKDETSEIQDPKQFENRAEYVLRKLERLGIKVLLGVCVYVALDTIRQVTVVNAINQPQVNTDQGP
jgi:hypothetical protein